LRGLGIVRFPTGEYSRNGAGRAAGAVATPSAKDTFSSLPQYVAKAIKPNSIERGRSGHQRRSALRPVPHGLAAPVSNGGNNKLHQNAFRWKSLVH